MAVGIKALSTTAATNATADSNINFQENQAPSTLNDSSRALMALLAAFYDQLGGSLTVGGSSSAYTITNAAPGTWSAYANGDVIMMKANHTNTGASTINVDSLGAKDIRTSDGGALVAGDIVSGAFCLLSYDSTGGYFQLVNTIAGGSYQPLDATNTAFAALVFSSTNAFLRATGADTFVAEAAAAHLTALGFSANAQSLIAAANYAAMRTLLDLEAGTDFYSIAAADSAISTAVSNHVAAGDPHTQYVLSSEIGSAVQAYSANLDEYAAVNPTAAGLALLDDAAASDQRTTLGLGTAATQNTGTSGANVPLMNGANTWSAKQTFSRSGVPIASNDTGSGTLHYEFQQGGVTRGYMGADATYLYFYDPSFNNVARLTWATGQILVGTSPVAVPTISSSDTLSNKTLSSPTLSGTVAGTPAVASGWTFNAGATFGNGNTGGTDRGIRINGADNTGSFIAWEENSATRWYSGRNVLTQVGNNNYSLYNNALGAQCWVAQIGTNVVDFTQTPTVGGNNVLTTATGAQLGVANTFTVNNKTVAGAPSYTIETSGGSLDGQFYVSGDETGIYAHAGNTLALWAHNTKFFTINTSGVLAGASGATIQARVATSSETGGSLTAASSNKQVNLASDPTIQASVHTADDRMVLYAGASARTITQGAGGTQRLHGSSTTGNLTLAARGEALVKFVSATEWVVMGDVS